MCEHPTTVNRAPFKANCCPDVFTKPVALGAGLEEVLDVVVVVETVVVDLLVVVVDVTVLVPGRHYPAVNVDALSDTVDRADLAIVRVDGCTNATSDTS
jgi:hypothetical protein